MTDAAIQSLELKLRHYLQTCGYGEDVPCFITDGPGYKEMRIGGARVPMTPSAPPHPDHAIPESMMAGYTMNGDVPVQYLYSMEPALDYVFHITNETYRIAFDLLDKREFEYYEDEINSFYDAFDKYDLSGKSVLVWGLLGCNCDAMALWKNASEVVIVDYNKQIFDHEKIIALNHEELERSNVKTDYSISFSSFEHDGLGRYKDPLDPNGDLRAMQDAKRFLKDDGIMFFGAPMARDCLLWNAHRIYGEKRLPLLLKGWACIDVFNSYSRLSPGFPFDLPLGACPQLLLVLKKIETDFPDDVWLDDYMKQIAAEIEIEGKSETTRDPHLLLKILGMIKTYKQSLSV